MKEREKEGLLIEYLSSKLCHDLAGSIGAIANSIEFLADPLLKENAEALLKQTSEKLMDQIQFLRKLYGYTDSSTSAELLKLLVLTRDYLRHKKIQLSFHSDEIKNISNINSLESKIIINVIYLCSNCLVNGGEVFLTLLENNSYLLLLKGRIIKFGQEIEKVILNSDFDRTSLDSRTAQAHYTLRLINQVKSFKLSLESHEHGQITFKLTKF